MSDSTTPMKKCKICNQLFPLTTEHFHQTHGGKYWNSYCIPCANKKSLDYRNANLESQREHNRQWYQANRETEADKQRQYREENPDKVAKTQQSWKQRNQDYWNDYMRQYRKDNPDKTRVIQQRRKARKYNLPDTFTTEQWVTCLEYHHYSCAVCGVQLRDLFGNVEPHADHWIPLTADNCPGTVAENMICLCAHCNQTKSFLAPDVWLTRTFGTRKANQILKRVQTYFEWVKRPLP